MNRKNVKNRVRLIFVIIILICFGLIIIMPLSQKNSMVKSTSFWVQTSDADYNNGTFDNVTMEGSGLDAVLKMDTIELNYWLNTIPKDGIKPTARSAHAMASVWGTDKIVLFGGYNGSSNDETWVYDLKNNSWMDKTPSPRPPNYPSSRYSHSMASVWGTNKVLLYGGSNLGDTWAYNINNNTWENMDPSIKPPIRYSHAIASIWGTDKVLLFGGKSPSDEYNDTWVYNLSNNTWTNKNPLGNKPDVRYWHSMASVNGTDNVVIFGGWDSSGGKNDTWVYDLSDNKWFQVTSINNPPARRNHAMASIHGTKNILLFGGYVRFNKYLDDTWIFTLNNNSHGNWTEITEMPIKPTNRYELAMAGIFGTNSVVLFGGTDHENYFNDTWIFNKFQYLNNGTFISIPYNIGSNSSFKTISWNGTTSINSSIKFQLRTGQTETDMSSKDFIGPDGSIISYYTSSPSTIWSGHNGDQGVQYKAYLRTKDPTITPILKNITIIYNVLPECPILINPFNNTLINHSKPVFTWMFIDNDSLQQNGFQLQIDDNEDFNSVNYDSGQIISNVSSFQPLTSITHGKLFWRVRTQDSDGDWGPYSKPWRLMIDSKPPSSILTTPINNSFYNSLNTITGTAFDILNGSGIYKVEIAIKQLNDNYYWNGSNWVTSKCWLLANGSSKWLYYSSSVPWLSDIRYSIQSRATDNATNVELPKIGNIFTYDDENVIFSNARPSFDNESPTEEVEVGITILDNTSGVNASTIEYAISEDMGNTWRAWVPIAGFEDSNSINITLNLTFPNGIGNRIKWRALDIAGNGPTESGTYQIKVNTWVQTLIPKVMLWLPENGSIIQSNSVELYWVIENLNLVDITYDVYFDTVNPPNATRAKGIMNTSFLIDDLSDGETYYWTVIPKHVNDEGLCVSGVWSFTVNRSVSLPTVTLTHPKNGSILPTLLPTLVWSVDYEGTEIVTFEVYLGSNKDPGREIMSYQKTYYLPETDLEDNTTYYWKVIPMAGDIQGPESETWSFTIKREFIPRFDLNLTLEPAMVELEAAEIAYIKAIVKNLGELNDTISLSIQIPNDINIDAIVNEPVTLDTAPEGIAVFNITIITPQGIKEGEINLIVMAVSEVAPEYGLSIEENAVLKVIILGAEKSESDKASTEIWIIFIIIVILIIVVLFFILLIKRRKRTEQEPSTVETGTDKPIDEPKPDILEGETTATPTLAQPLKDTAISTPKLASLETVGETPTQQQIPQVAQMEQKPQLPPAQTQETKTEDGIAIPETAEITPSPALESTIQPELQVDVPQELNLDQTPNPTIAQQQPLETDIEQSQGQVGKEEESKNTNLDS